jgi:ribose-phosphate pyrophosphokinase
MLMQANQPDFMVFTGNANPALAAEIARHLGTTLGAADVGRFPTAKSRSKSSRT